MCSSLSPVLCRWLSSLCLYMVLSWCVCLCPNSFQYWSKADPLTPFYLNYPLKYPITKSNHILKPLGLRSSTYDFEGDTMQPITKMILFFLI